MAHLIDKSALVAEIQRWIELLTNEKNQEGISQIDKLSLGGRIAELQEVKSFIDTLEVKEVDFDTEWNRYFEHRGEMATVNIKHLAKHFFVLGIQVAQKEEA